MKFNIDNYNGKYVMHCKTEEEAKDFCNYLYRIGRKWLSGTTYKNENYYSRYEKETVYYFNEGAYANIKCARDNNYTILEWEDFMNKEFTKADLKTGDVVKFRCGETGIINCNLDMIITQEGWVGLDTYNKNLIDTINHNYDVVAVRRPNTQGACQFGAFKKQFGTLVYEREEVEEMTLAEVCKLLGKNIKIVK